MSAHLPARLPVFPLAMGNVAMGGVFKKVGRVLSRAIGSISFTRLMQRKFDQW